MKLRIGIASLIVVAACSKGGGQTKKQAFELLCDKAAIEKVMGGPGTADGVAKLYEWSERAIKNADAKAAVAALVAADPYQRNLALMTATADLDMACPTMGLFVPQPVPADDPTIAATRAWALDLGAKVLDGFKGTPDPALLAADPERDIRKKDCSLLPAGQCNSPADTRPSESFRLSDPAATIAVVAVTVQVGRGSRRLDLGLLAIADPVKAWFGGATLQTLVARESSSVRGQPFALPPLEAYIDRMMACAVPPGCELPFRSTLPLGTYFESLSSSHEVTQVYAATRNGADVTDWEPTAIDIAVLVTTDVADVSRQGVTAFWIRTTLESDSGALYLGPADTMSTNL